MTKQVSSMTTQPHLKLFVVMGVSGSGKTVIGKQLVKELNHNGNVEFLDADDFHMLEAKQRMTANLPLDDAMRKPWIEAIIRKLNELSSQNINVVLAYSGLKQQHRKCFTVLDYQCQFYYLSAPIDIIRQRLQARKEHFFNVDLLASQFIAMEDLTDEEQGEVTTIDASAPFEQVYAQVLTLAKTSFSKRGLS